MVSPESPEGAASTRIESRHFQEGTGVQGQGWAAILESSCQGWSWGQVTPAAELLVDSILHPLCHMHVCFSASE